MNARGFGRRYLYLDVVRGNDASVQVLLLLQVSDGGKEVGHTGLC